MSVGHDAATRWPAGAATDAVAGARTFTHTPVGTPKGVCVMIAATASFSVVSAVTYGSLTLIAEGIATDVTEVGSVEIWRSADDAVIPTGAQTVTITASSTTAKWATCVTMTASTPTVRMVGWGIKNTTTLANPSIDILGYPGSLMYGALHTGAAAPSASPLTGVTLLHNMDYGQLAAQTFRLTAARSTPGRSTIGVTLASDDYAIAGISFAEFVRNDSALVEQNPPETIVRTTSATPSLFMVGDSGTDTLLVVEITGEGNGVGGDVQCTAMTWNGVAMTRLDRQAGATWGWAEVWYLVNPAAASSSVQATLNNSDTTILHGQFYDGAGTPTGAGKSTGSGGNSASISATSTPGSSDLLRSVLQVDGPDRGQNATASGATLSGYDSDSISHTGAFARTDGSNGGTMGWSWTTASSYSGITYIVPMASTSTPKTGTDATTAGSDTGTNTATIPAADVDGVGAESAVTTYTPVGGDAAGAGTDTAVVTKLVTDSDGAAFPVEVAAVSAVEPAADASSAATDAAARNATIPATDSGAGSDAAAISTVAAASDVTGGGSDLAVISAVEPAADSGGGTTESGAVTATQQVPGADAGSSADIATMSFGGTAADATGAGSDQATLLAQRAGADASGAGADLGAMTAAAPGSDSGSGADSGSITANQQVAGTDAMGVLVEAASLIAATTGADQDGAGVESGVIGLYGSDVNGGVVESGSYRMNVNVADVSGAVIEATALLASLAAADSAVTALDNAVVQYLAVGSDVDGANLELAAVAIVIVTPDNGSGVETAIVTAVSLAGTDIGTGADVGQLTGAVTSKQANDVGVGTDLAGLFRGIASVDLSNAAVDAALAVYQAVGTDFDGTILETAFMVASILAAEQKLVTDLATITYSPAGTDTDGANVETGAVQVGTVFPAGTDAGAGTDAASMLGISATVDQALALENLAALLVSVVATDGALGTDFGIRVIKGVLAAIATGKVVVRNQSGEVVSNLDSGRVRS